MILLRKRSQELELLDQPERASREEMVGALEGLRRVNRFLGGCSLTIRYAIPMMERARRSGANPVRLCDIGTGSGDIPIALAKAARRRRIPVAITAVEMNADLAAAARKACAPFPEITVLHADATEILRAAARREKKLEGERNGIARCEPFDIVTACLFTHHFPPEDVSAWIALMDAASRQGWLINDLERHPMALVGIKVAGPFLSRNRVFLHDAPLSVRRAYTVGEWKEMLLRAGVRQAAITRHWPWRLIVRRNHKPG